MQNTQAKKPIKIAFYLENYNIPDVDLAQPELGNPGCGGTEYLFVATPYYLQKYACEQYSPIILANHSKNLPNNIKKYQVNTVNEAAKKAKDLGADIFIYRPRRNEEEGFLNLLQTLQIPTIGWAHITPKPNYLRHMAQCAALKALVCVEHEQYDQTQDSTLACQGKSTFIVNGFDVDQFRLDKNEIPQKDEKLVAYLGALVYQKGFHLLAQVWPKVIKRVPDAKLAVIGSGKLYDANAKLGPWNIADHDYETKHIIPYLSDKNGETHPSVTFFGKLGIEKKDILHRALIGVPNPTGNTENCPGSALEFQACSTTVVSGAYWGMLDTIDHNITGLLSKTPQGLENSIVDFLQNPQKAKDYGERGMSFVKEKYNWPNVIQKWDALFQTIQNNQKPKYIPFKNNYGDHYKWLIAINRIIQKTIGRIIFWPSTIEIRHYLHPKLSTLKSKLKR